MTLRLPNLEIDRDGDGPDDEVMLTQDIGGNDHTVYLHPCQVRLLAERMGILVPDADSQRTIARLSRQMRTLLERIDELDDLIKEAAARGHEDLEVEMAFSFATWQVAREFCADLPAETREIQATAAKPSTAPAKVQSVAPTANAARQRRHRERQKQQRNGASVMPVTDAARVTALQHTSPATSVKGTTS